MPDTIEILGEYNQNGFTVWLIKPDQLHPEELTYQGNHRSDPDIITDDIGERMPLLAIRDTCADAVRNFNMSYKTALTTVRQIP